MTTAIIGIGPPGSGRVNFFRDLIDAGISAQYHYWDEGYGNFDGLNHTSAVINAKAKFFNKIAENLQSGVNVIADATNTIPDARKLLTSWCRQHGAETIIGVIINAPRRGQPTTSTRDDRCRSSVRENMQRHLMTHPPTHDEGFDQIKSLAAYL